MATATTQHDTFEEITVSAKSHDAARVLPLIGRVLFAAIFLASTPTLFSSKGISAAAANGLPFADALVPLAGVLALVGGLSVLLGYRAKMGAWLLIAFLVPVTLVMHNFSSEMQMVNFMKNGALIGGALFITYFGAGPLSLDARAARLEITSR